MSKFSSPFLAKSPLNTPQPWETTIAGQAEGDDRFLDINLSPVNPDGTPRYQTSSEKYLIASQQKEDIASQQKDSKSPVNNGKSPKRGRLHSYEIDNPEYSGKISDENAIVSFESGLTSFNQDISNWDTTKINDPKNILTRPKTRKEFKKGYRYKKEDDGSLTLKGRKKVSTKTKDGHHKWVGVNVREDLQPRYQ